MAGAAGIAGEVFAAECGGDVGLGPALSDGGDAEGHICRGWPSMVVRRRTEERDGRGVLAEGAGCEAETHGGAFSFCLLLERKQSGTEGVGFGEDCSGRTAKMGERVKTGLGAVLRLTVGEAGGTTEPPPIGGATICAELLGKSFRGEGTNLLGNGCVCLSQAWKLPGLVSTTAAGA